MVLVYTYILKGKYKRIPGLGAEQKQLYLAENSSHQDSAIFTPELDGKFNIFLPKDLQLFKKVLQKKANEDKTVILFVVDVPFVDMAINLYETSFLKHNITNYIFVCAHQKATQMLTLANLDAITGWHDIKGEISTNFGSRHFFCKNLYKTIATFFALKMGYNILVMDVDIILLKNPFPYFVRYECDIIFTTEGNTHLLNGGFYLAFSTTNSLSLHKAVIDAVINSKFVSHEQESFNRLINTHKSVHIIKLDFITNFKMVECILK